MVERVHDFTAAIQEAWLQSPGMTSLVRFAPVPTDAGSSTVIGLEDVEQFAASTQRHDDLREASAHRHADRLRAQKGRDVLWMIIGKDSTGAKPSELPWLRSSSSEG